MNKPEYYKLIGHSTVDKYIDFIHSNRLEFKQNLKYDREEYFIRSRTCFLIERFVNLNPKLYDKFFSISKDLYHLLKNEYGDGVIFNLQFSLLPNGGKILPHSDLGIGFAFSHRIHIPIITNQNNEFVIDEKKFHFKPGQIVEINNKKFHSVENLNTSLFHRIHIILDYAPLIYEKFIPK